MWSRSEPSDLILTMSLQRAFELSGPSLLPFPKLSSASLNIFRFPEWTPTLP